MSSQASVHSVEALKDLRVALALYGDDTLGALGAIESEVRRTVRWLEQERPAYWQDQIKRRRELVSQARAEVFRKNLQKRPDYTPPMSEQKENLRKAEASLQDAEKRLTMVKKWQPKLQHAVLEYHGSVQRLKDLAGADVPAAVDLLSKLIDALEAYLRVQPPSGTGLEAGPSRASAGMESIATRMIAEAPPPAKPAVSEPAAGEPEAPPPPEQADEAPAADGQPPGAGPAE